MECFSQLNIAAIGILRDTHRFYQVIVRDLRKQMVNHMCSNIMVNIVNPSIVAVKCCKPSPKITPFLSNTRQNIQTFYTKKAKVGIFLFCLSVSKCNNHSSW